MTFTLEDVTWPNETALVYATTDREDIERKANKLTEQGNKFLLCTWEKGEIVEKVEYYHTGEALVVTKLKD